jgi:hypothetical protein
MEESVARTDYYDLFGKLLGSFGVAAPITRRFISRDDYNTITSSSNLELQVATKLYKDETTPGFGHAPPIIADPDKLGAFASKSQSITDKAQSLLVAGSRVLSIQQNGPAFIANLVQDAKRTRKETGAYVVLQFSGPNLAYVTAVSTASSEEDFKFDIGIPRGSPNTRTLPRDASQLVIATVHTHYANVRAMHEANPDHTYSIVPEVSRKDRASARENFIIVYAVDAGYVHRADPNGLVFNKMSRQLDILVDAVDAYGRI